MTKEDKIIDQWIDRIIRGKIKKLKQKDIIKMLNDIKKELIEENAT